MTEAPLCLPNESPSHAEIRAFIAEQTNNCLSADAEKRYGSAEQLTHNAGTRHPCFKVIFVIF